MTSFAKKSILSTADVARLFNVTETTVKRWADEGTLRCQKTPGGHRKFEVRNVVEFAEVNHFEPVGTLAIPEEDRLAQRIQVATLGRDFSELIAAYVEKALAPDRAGLFPFVSYLYQHRVQLWEMYDLVVRPGMAEIGERFVRGEIGVNHEHRASYETLDALSKLQAQIHIKPSAGRSVVCACVGEDLHEIGLRCASYIFESEGWMVIYLGARIPAEAVQSAIGELKPDLACLSVTHPAVGESHLDALGKITRGARESGCRVILGGRVAASLSLPPGSVDAVHDSARGLLDYIAVFDRVAAALKTA
jgi:MerR family transcriptional regulator, light-induced transcriptional regulator